VDLKNETMLNIKQIFTWWHRQTIGTFLKTLFFGTLVGSDQYGNKYYKSKKDERWIVFSGKIEATQITSDWFLWMHHTVNEIPDKNKKKYLWQKEHSENLTGTNNSYKPNKISRSNVKKKYETWQS
jgi:NADH:ubiquinone oxidoreductase subunit